MGRDKALIPHSRGGVWLTFLLDQLSDLALPVVVVSGHGEHAAYTHGTFLQVIFWRDVRHPAQLIGVMPNTTLN